MMEKILQNSFSKAIQNLYGIELDSHTLLLQRTRKEFDGDFTIVVFPFLNARTYKKYKPLLLFAFL